jgi:DNA polymerase-3 subunit gamma/tau
VAPDVVEAVTHDQPDVAAAEPAGPAEALPSQDELVQAWGDQVISRLRPKAKALFQAGRFVGTESGRISFGLPNEIHRDRCEEMRPEVEAALADHFGRAVPLVLVVDGGPAPVAAPQVDAPLTPADAPEPAPAVDLSAGPQAARAAAEAPPVFDEVADDEDEVVEDLAVFEDEDLVEADVDNSAEARLLEAFPGAEEVG